MSLSVYCRIRSNLSSKVLYFYAENSAKLRKRLARGLHVQNRWWRHTSRLIAFLTVQNDLQYFFCANIIPYFLVFLRVPF